MNEVAQKTYCPKWFQDPAIVDSMLTKLASHRSFSSMLEGRDMRAAAGDSPLERINQATLAAGLERLAEIIEEFTEVQADLEEMAGVSRYGDQEFAKTFCWAFGRPVDERGDIIVVPDPQRMNCDEPAPQTERSL